MADTILYQEALRVIREQAGQEWEIETLPVEKSVGRVLSRDVQSSWTLPEYDNSAVDGFALRSVDTKGPFPLRLKIQGRFVAGDSRHSADSNGAWEIMTGAPFPAGYDCSVKIEDTEVVRDSSGRAIEIVLHSQVERGQNLRPAGEDFRPGAKVFRAGETVSPMHVLGAAALGITSFSLWRAPRIALISTGKEVVDAASAEVAPGQVRNSTAPFLRVALAQQGWKVVYQTAVGDEAQDFYQALKDALAERPDAIVTTGAVSMGVHDYVSTVVADLGGRTYFHRVAIRPGKPLLFSRFGETGPVLFGLPGNPVSTVVGLRFFVEPYFRACLRLKPEAPLRARLAARASKPEGLRCFFKAGLELGREPKVTVLRGQASFMISPLLEANAWVILPEEGSSTPEGTEVDVYPMFTNSGFFESKESKSHQIDQYGADRADDCCHGRHK